MRRVVTPYSTFGGSVAGILSCQSNESMGSYFICQSHLVFRELVWTFGFYCGHGLGAPVTEITFLHSNHGNEITLDAKYLLVLEWTVNKQEC